MKSPRLRALAVLVFLALLGLLLYRRTQAKHEAEAERSDPVRAQQREFRDRLALIAGQQRRMSPDLPVYDLEGRVVDAENRPVARATVVLSQPARSIESDGAGRFVFAKLPAGSYSLEARSDTMVGGPKRHHLGPGSAPALLRLYHGARIEVEVVSAAGKQPIDGAEVELVLVHMYPGAGVFRGRTDRNGKARFPGAIINAYHLYVSAAGFADFRGSAEPTHAEAGVWKEHVELQPGAEQSGEVVDETGAPVAGATVEAVPYRASAPRAMSDEDQKNFGSAPKQANTVTRVGPLTGPDGRFRLGLPPGPWILVATHERFQTGLSAPIVTDGKQPHDHIRIVCKRGRRVSGAVVTMDNKPVPGAMVQALWQYVDRFEKQVRADGTGHFELTGLPEAPMTFLALAENGSSPPLRLDLSKLSSDPEIVLALENTGEITGEVLDMAGKPITDAQVFYVEVAAVGANKVFPAVETSGEDGRFRIRGVALGPTYAVSAQRSQDGDVSVRHAHVEAHAGDDVTLRIPDDGQLVGRVLVEGVPTPGLTIEADEAAQTAVSGKGGRFQFARLPPREYTLRIGGPTVADSFVHDVRVTADQVTDVGDIKVSRGRTVSGVVLRSDGSKADSAIVRMTVDNSFSLEHPTQGDNTFSFLAPTGSTISLQANGMHGAATEAVTVGPDDPAQGVKLVFRAGGTIEGSITAKAQPVGYANIFVFARGQERAATPAAQTMGDGSGYYHFDGIPAGDYTVQVRLTEPQTHRVGTYSQSASVAVAGRAVVDFDVSAGFEGAVPLPPTTGPAAPPLHESHGH